MEIRDVFKIDRDKEFIFPDCKLFFHGDGIMTEYLDGYSSYNFVPQDGGYFKDIAVSIGFEENDLLSYLCEHEYVHHFICRKMFNESSYVIRNAALNKPLDPVASGLEEKMCYYFQMFMHWKCPMIDRVWVDWVPEAKEELYSMSEGTL